MFKNDNQNEYQNNLDGKYLGTITKDFVKIADTIKEAAYQIVMQGFSDYPIFPICKEKMALGQELIPKELFQLDWNYNVSFLDEFVQRELITIENMDNFKNIYRDYNEFCCLFVVDITDTSFIFVPYPVD